MSVVKPRRIPSDGEFDYVVVGAGSAGCVLASRLTEDPSVSVALIEAGGRDRNPWLHIPAGYFRTMFDPSVTWQYESGPEPHLNGRMVPWPRGRVLGGSSAINGLLYVRGQRQDYDTWRQLGNAGWSYEDVLPYFKRAERQERCAGELHGVDGPLAVTDVRWRGNALCEAYIKACMAEGIPRNDDFNGSTQEGVGYYQLTVGKARRASTAVAYLRPARGRRNLSIITDAVCLGLDLDGSKRVRGVRIGKETGERRVEARREVLLAAGAIGSPQLLELSGIGAGDVLRRAGMEVRHELPGIGESLQDHLQVRFVYECSLPDSLNKVWHSPWLKAKTGLQYLTTGTGPLTIGAGVVGVFTRSRPGLEAPDIQFHFMPLAAIRPGQGLHKFSGVTASVCQLRPESRGSIHITSPDPMAKPAIVSNYLAAGEDQRVILDGMRLARRIARRAEFAQHVLTEHTPGPGVATDEQLMDAARNIGTTVFHPTSTCRMGSDTRAVVDQRLRVRGIAGLRVVDASVMPQLMSGNTNAPTIMIAEKASDMIKEDARISFGPI